MKSILFSLLCAGAFLWTAPLPAEEPDFSDYPFVKRAELGAGEKGAASGFLPLDAELYRALDDGFTNLRLTTISGRQVPFVVRNRKTARTLSELFLMDTNIDSFHYDKAKNAATITAHWKKPQIISGLYLHTSNRNFDKTLTLELDGKTVLQQKPFFDNSKNIRLTSNSYEFAPVEAKNLRLTVERFVEQNEDDSKLIRKGGTDSFAEQKIFVDHLKLDAIRLRCLNRRVEWTTDCNRVQPLPLLDRKEKEGKTILTFDAGRIPLRRMTLSSITPRYSRPATVRFLRDGKDAEGKPIEQEMRQISATFTPNITNLTFEELRADRVECTIQNGDNAPLEQIETQFFSYDKGLLWESTTLNGDSELLLFYGGTKSKRPHYDLERYCAEFENAPQVGFLCGPQTDNPNFGAPPRRSRSAGEWAKQLLPYLLGLAALALAVVAYRMFRRIDETPSAQ